MRNQSLRLPVLLALLAALPATTGCAEKVVVGVNTGGGATTGGATTGGTSGSGATGSGASGSGASGTGGAYTSRLTGPQPGMVTVSSPSGVSYSIDSTEVSQADYALFLASAPVPDPTSASCGWKANFAPGQDPNDANNGPGDPLSCTTTNTYYDPTTTGTDPVVCVDWCDAAAYCEWAGKRLCGHVGGGPAVGTMTEDDFGDTTGQWYNACSNAGTTPFPYGSTYVAGTCNDGTTVAAVGTTAGCHAPTGPASGIFDMSGNVGEWEDFCQVNPFDQDGGVPDAQCCAVRGGSFSQYGAPTGGPNPAGSEYICGETYAGKHFGFECGARNYMDSFTGFRCCVD